jgi:hypothetical protein
VQGASPALVTETLQKKNKKTEAFFSGNAGRGFQQCQREGGQQQQV